MSRSTELGRVAAGLVTASTVLAFALFPAMAQSARTRQKPPAKKKAPAATVATPVPTPPPLIDRELFFGDPEIIGAQISPDGRYLAFIKPYKGTRNIWVKAVAEPFGAARPVTADTRRPIPAYFWSRDGRFILYVQDQGGDENYNVYAVNPGDKPAAGGEVPAARNLTDLKKVRTVIHEVPKSDPDTIFVGLNDRDPAWHDLYKVKLSTGERTLVRQNTDRVTGWVFDLKGELRLATRSAENGDTEVLRVDAKGFTRVYSCSVTETCGPLRFHKDHKRVYMLTNKGAAVDLTRLVLFDPESGKEELVESDPMNRVDFGGAVFSEVSENLLATTYQDDRLRVYFRDKPFEADYQLIQGKMPGKEIGFSSSTSDERLWIVSAASDVEPGETYLFDRKTKQLTLQYRVREKIVRNDLAPMRSIRYASSDGLEIPAYLTLPKGVPARDLPAVVVPHGGPWARDSFGYNAFAEFLANRGYAVLMPNFRGSTGYGKRFLNAGSRQWGDKMQDDITWGVKYLEAQGIADPKRIAIMGGSYGGYATLAGVAFTPDLYAAAVSIVGPSNLITLLDSIPPYWEAARKLFLERMGDPSTPAGKAQLERQSPLTSAAKIRTPLLVVQGANDPRVKKAESDQIVVALRDRGFPVEYLVAPDEGHGFARPVNNMAMFAAAEKFLAKHLAGRFQDSMTPEVAERLKAIAVDPATVTMPARPIPAPATAPRVTTGLQPGTWNYKVRIQAGGESQTTEFTATTDVRAEGDTWVVTETARMETGQSVDRATLDKTTLVLEKRAITQGPLTITLEVKGTRVTGEMKASGQARPFAVDVPGPLFADGAGAYNVIAALPLADLYTATYSNLDVQTQKAHGFELKVVGSEPVTIAAGTFEAFKVETTSDGGAKTTIWIAKGDRRVLKVVSVLPQLNGATITSELQK